MTDSTLLVLLQRAGMSPVDAQALLVRWESDGPGGGEIPSLDGYAQIDDDLLSAPDDTSIVWSGGKLIPGPPPGEGPKGDPGDAGTNGTGQPVVFWDTGNDAWPARPISTVPVVYKSMTVNDAAEPADPAEGDEWIRKL